MKNLPSSCQENITPLELYKFLCNTFCKTQFVCNHAAWKFLSYLICYLPNLLLLYNLHPTQKNKSNGYDRVTFQETNLNPVHSYVASEIPEVPTAIFFFTYAHCIFFILLSLFGTAWSPWITGSNPSKVPPSHTNLSINRERHFSKNILN